MSSSPDSRHTCSTCALPAEVQVQVSRSSDHPDAHIASVRTSSVLSILQTCQLRNRRWRGRAPANAARDAAVAESGPECPARGVADAGSDGVPCGPSAAASAVDADARETDPQGRSRVVHTLVDGVPTEPHRSPMLCTKFHNSWKCGGHEEHQNAWLDMQWANLSRRTLQCRKPFRPLLFRAKRRRPRRVATPLPPAARPWFQRSKTRRNDAGKERQKRERRHQSIQLCVGCLVGKDLGRFVFWVWCVIGAGALERT